jgi:hypothetical protein
MAYDSARDRVVLFGGNNTTYGPLADTWEWDGTNWTQRFVGGFPPARHEHALAYDSLRGKTVLFGGTQGGTYYNDTWEWDGTAWALRAAGPPASRSHALAFSVARRRTILFGGYGPSHSGEETWEWDGTRWDRRVTYCSCPCVPSPTGRYGHALAYDAARARTVLFGGYSSTYLNETWEYESLDQPPSCSTLGRGHCATGSLFFTCSTPPRIGTNFCSTFSDPGQAGFHLLYISIPPSPGIPFSSPAICSSGYLYAFPPIIVLQFVGNPAVFCVPLPNEPLLVGQRFGLQGGSFQINSCFRLTDGLAVTVQP